MGIIGGGILGLTAAYDLARGGHQVTLFEKEREAGGQLATFQVGGARLEKFYHHIFKHDREVIDLTQELGLGDKLRWLDSRVGFFHGGKIYHFVTPLDLLCFTPVGFFDRLRLGLIGLYLRRYQDWRQLEGITAREWIIRQAGQRNYDVVWGPLLRGKFGQSADEVGMVWFWGKIHLRFASRSGGGQREQLGYLQGSFGLLNDTLLQRAQELGAQIKLGCPVTRILKENGALALQVQEKGESKRYTFEVVLATVPSPAFLRLAPPLPQDYASRLASLRYQEALCLVLTLKRPLSHIYWLNLSDPSLPFVAIIEQTNLIDKAEYGGKHVVYLSNYLSAGHPFLKATPDELLALYLPHLQKINPDFDASWVEERYLFHEEGAQPVVTTHYSQKIPEHATPIPGLFLANTTQIYPQDRGINYSVLLGRRMSQLVVGKRTSA